MRRKGGIARAVGAVAETTIQLLRAAFVKEVGQADQMRQAIEASPAGMLMIDAEGRILLVNREVERLFGYGRDELLGRPVELLVPQAARSRHLQRRHSFAREPRRRSMGSGQALHGQRKDGSEFALEIGLNPVRIGADAFVIASIVDVGAREELQRQREQILHEQRALNAELERRVAARTTALAAALADKQAREHWFSITMRSLADAVVSVDAAGAVVFMNPAAEQLLGVRFEQANGMPARSIMRLRGEAGESECPLERALRERQVVQLREATLIAPEERLIADSAAPVVDGDRLLGAVMVFRDVTEARRTQRQLEIAERMASLGTLAAGVAHEINNPLFVVMANAEFMTEHFQSLVSAGAALDEIVRAQRDLTSAAARIQRIVADLKTFSRPDPSGGGSCDVQEAIGWAVRSTAHEFRGRASVIVEAAPTSRAAADETRVGQILVNLLLNAAQAFAPERIQRNRVVIRTRSDQAGNVRVEIADNGPGMSPAVAARIFEPFFTTKPVGVGTGLGLAICRGLVTSLGGSLAVESRVGEGSTFHLTLPAAHASGVAEQPPRSRRAAGRARVLLVDDDPLVLNAMVRSLSRHAVATATDGRAALALLDQDRDIDVIFCDLLMPTMTGMELYERLQQTQPAAASRIVFLSGGVVGGALAEFLERVPNECLQKPFAAGTLETIVERMLRQRA